MLPVCKKLKKTSPAQKWEGIQIHIGLAMVLLVEVPYAMCSVGKNPTASSAFVWIQQMLIVLCWLPGRSLHRHSPPPSFLNRWSALSELIIASICFSPMPHMVSWGLVPTGIKEIYFPLKTQFRSWPTKNGF